MESKVSIVIPFCNRWDLTHQLLYDIFVHCKPDVEEVVCVDNGSTEITGLSWWEKGQLLNVKGIVIKEQLGFVKAVNLGVLQSSGDIKVIISNDVRIHKHIVPEILGHLKSNPKSIVGAMLRNYDTGWNKFGDRIFPYLEGWFLSMTSESWTDIGGLDVRFSPYDYEDVDFSTTAISKGYSLVTLSAGCVSHIGAQTIGYNENRLEQTEINRDKFGEKWVSQTKSK